MTIAIAHLGPTGTNAETAALAYASWLTNKKGQEFLLYPYPSIAQTLRSVDRQEVDLAVVPVENSTEGSVAITLDTLWELDRLQIQQELVLRISHALLSHSKSLSEIKTVYSHPQALAQCQKWLEGFLPSVQLIPTNSTTEAVQQVSQDPQAGAIAAPRASKLYDVPILAVDINDYPDNCTRFWVMGLAPSTSGNRTSVAFSVPANVPGALVKPLQVFAQRGINLSRIESRPTKRSLGEYLFFLDLEASATETSTQETLAELSPHTEVLKIFGSYDVLPISTP
ncbi:MAG: prephenate dehydratase [Hydrococcus sp. C42_A2020_068]|uniref:prephenate dehydratase n=1 Tax=Pleurocapsa sp. PCC 7327 TaxID=118163 RepID=UPI00029F9920|nr:prephenate dehydratase [Pleurocapsa sp. PCC 7327]AFY79693.1 prephenate dehydratase [Pleurocapsa sp. PCC 7327]MBF2021269.1 prephenate dehydratase [Hydrococcus sp. C42_A2020_068]